MTEQWQFLFLHNNFPGKHLFSCIVKTNALLCGPDFTIGGVYSIVCLINHSCLSNAHNNWNSDKMCETIHTIRYIKFGKEITSSYDRGGPNRILNQANECLADCHCLLQVLDEE